ncbi:MAG: hypothetical protein ABSF95_14560 [Verrucomicrobiota bacterium]|jgi:hypothetical protein
MGQSLPASPVPVQPKNSALAVVSLVLGILGLVCLCIGPLAAYLAARAELPMPSGFLRVVLLLWCVGPLPAFLALRCARIAASRIKCAPALFRGRRTALAGLVMGYMSIALFVVIAIVLVCYAVSFTGR